ncbi:hypothetical protein EDB92DRAFT_635788 [Lactarius akahatsu]|uniref:Secreted protein n=1 Tax=Lactarius akahatsu TaxID=416441 RepID=A0AAD4L641_9AGAM|nr:hypothetical protein EDB92DRAFT_635788 [Lactarius akahatsu]
MLVRLLSPQRLVLVFFVVVVVQTAPDQPKHILYLQHQCVTTSPPDVNVPVMSYHRYCYLNGNNHTDMQPLRSQGYDGLPLAIGTEAVPDTIVVFFF